MSNILLFINWVRGPYQKVQARSPSDSSNLLFRWPKVSKPFVFRFRSRLPTKMVPLTYQYQNSIKVDRASTSCSLNFSYFQVDFPYFLRQTYMSFKLIGLHWIRFWLIIHSVSIESYCFNLICGFCGSVSSLTHWTTTGSCMGFPGHCMGLQGCMWFTDWQLNDQHFSKPGLYESVTFFFISVILWILIPFDFSCSLKLGSICILE